MVRYHADVSPMPPTRGEVPMHPMTVADLLDGSFRLLRSNARVVLPAAAMFIVPAQLASFVLQVRTGIPEYSGTGATVFTGPLPADSGTSSDVLVAVMATLLNLLTVALVAGVACQVVVGSHAGDDQSVWQVLRRVRERSWALLGGWIVVHVLEAAGLLVLGAPALGAWWGGLDDLALGLLVIGLVLSAPVAFVVMTLSVAVAPCTLIENLGPLSAVRRSWRLVRRRFWPTAVVALSAGLISSIVAQVLSVLPAAIGIGIGGVAGTALLTMTSIVTLSITQPFVAFVAALQYLDARIRTEGLDLHMVADRLLAAES